MCINCTFTTEKLHALLFATSKCEQTAPLLTIVLNISQASASLSAEIWGLITVLKWRMAERKRISLRDHWSHFGL